MKLRAKNPAFLAEDFPTVASLPLPDGRREVTHLHECPVCGKGHRVNEVRHALAYGRQLTCSCDCERRKRRERRCS